MDYLVVYTSKTGNTQKVAMKIFEALPGKSKDIVNLEEYHGEEADTYFVGFWNNRGICTTEVIDFLSDLHGKQIALFGTCGIFENKEYLKQVENQVSVFLPEDNEYLGCYLCGGKMGPKVLEKCRQMQAQLNTPQIREMILAYEDAMLHPNKEDLDQAGVFTESVLNRIQRKKEERDGIKR
ncbi:flavodoxin family protein BilS [Lacrimispora sp.]|jgi:flavodoxin|uniref:flavodoxin family protein BilS n=1 Tax=Lacrimispora sp. TaxID=2719234 RepID=UPI0032E44B26|nr:flavodoxin [Paenibacillaceae bacterium]